MANSLPGFGQQAYQILREDGFNHTGAIAVLASIDDETGGTYDPTTKQKLNDGKIGKGRGLFQHEVGGRFDTDPINLKKFAKQRGTEWDDPETQMKFMLHELDRNPRFKDLKTELNNMPLDKATDRFLEVYEGASDPHSEKRQKSAAKLNNIVGYQNPEPELEPELQEQSPAITDQAGGDPQPLENPEQYAQPDEVPDIPSQTAEGLAQDMPQQAPKSRLSPDNPFSDEYIAAENFNSKKSKLSADNPFSDEYIAAEKSNNTPQQKAGLWDVTKATGNLIKGQLFGKDDPYTPPAGLAGAAGRVATGLAEDTVGELKSLGSNMMKHGLSTPKFIAQNPGQAAQAVGGGVAGIADSVLNTPGNIPAISEHFGITGPGSGDISKKIPKANLAKSMIPENESEEAKLIRQATEDLPIVMPVLRGAKQATKLAKDSALSGFKGEDPILAKKATALEEEITKHKADLEKANAEYAKSKEATTAAKAKAKQETGKADPDSMIYATKKSTENIADLDKTIDDMHKQIKENKPVASMDAEVAESESQVKQAEKQHSEAVDTHTKIDESIAKHLNSGDTHHVNLGERLDDVTDAAKKDIQKSYKQVEESVADKNVVLSRKELPTMKDITEELNRLASEGKAESENAMDLFHELQEHGLRETMPAQAAIRAYKTTKFYIRDAYNKAYQTGKEVSQEYRDKWKKTAEELEGVQDKMKGILKKGIGKEDFDTLTNADARWRDEVASLYKHPVFNAFKTRGRRKTGKNVMDQLTGSERGTDVLKGHIKNDPEMLKSIVGQQLDASPAQFAKKLDSKMMKEYLDEMPDLRRLLDAKKQANSNIEMAKSAVGKAKADHAKVKDQVKEVNPKIKEYEAQHAKLTNEVEKAKASRDAATQQIKDLEPHIKELQSRLKTEKLNLENKVTMEAKLKKMKAQLDELTKKRSESEGILRQSLVAGYRLIKKYGAKALIGGLK